MIGRLLAWIVRAAFAVASLRFALDALRSPGRLARDAAAQQTLAATRPLGKRLLFTGLLLMVIAGIGGALVVVSGVVPIKASSGHWSITEAFLQFAKRRSVATHSFRIKPPALDETRLVVTGAGHYDFACRPCHGSPALEQPRIAARMLPTPPDLRTSVARYDPGELFYIVKHGIKLTGMPAWPAPQRDDEVWAMVAFLRRLPALGPTEYEELATGGEPAGDARVPLEDLVAPQRVPATITESCSRCHGVDGLARDVGAFPKLAGQRPVYLFASMYAYARGQRHSGIMEPVAASLGADEMREIAEYYASRPRGESRTGAANGGELVEDGRAIATRGLPDRLVPACVTCHGPGDHRRNPMYPLLAGQYAAYIEQQLTLFKHDRRGGTPYRGIMRKVASQLTDEQMRAVAAYYASLPGGS